MPWLGPNEAGTTTFALHVAESTPGFDSAGVMGLMRADLEGARSGSLAGQTLRSPNLRPSDLTNDEEPKLVCGTDIILIDGAESCLDHQSKDDKWAQACAAQAERTGASAEHNVCWEQGDGNFNECICIDKTTAIVEPPPQCIPHADDPAMVDRATKTCHYVNTGAQENNSCGKPCNKQAEVCETSLETMVWLNCH